MRLYICGVRGSTPAPGPEFVRYGGHTSCVALSHADERPALVLDAGTGIRRVTPLLNGSPFRGTVLLGHLHWDHTTGLPFFGAGNRPESKTHVLMPSQGRAQDVLDRAMSPPFFPVTLGELTGNWTCGSVEPGTFELEGFEVTSIEIPHKGGRMFGYRITDGSATIAYMSDHSPINMGPGPDGLGDYHDAACKLADGVDLLIHDAQYTAEEFEQRKHYGHSAVEYTVRLAESCGSRRLLLFHHDPPRTDDAIDEIVASCRTARIPVEAAAEATVIDL